MTSKLPPLTDLTNFAAMLRQQQGFDTVVNVPPAQQTFKLPNGQGVMKVNALPSVQLVRNPDADTFGQ